MDPLTLVGAIASVATLVDTGAKLCVSLNGMARSFSSAPEAISLMNRGVSSLVSVLHQLQTALENGNSNGLDLAKEARIDLQNILESCGLVLASLKTILNKFEHCPKELEGASTTVTKINTIKLRFRWMIEEKEVVRIRKSLDTHVQTLQLTLTATTALVTAVTKKDTTEIIALLDDLRSSLKRTAALTSATVVRPRVQTPFQSAIHHLPTPAVQEIEAEVSPAAIVDQPANAELHSVPNFSGHQSTSIPTEPSEPGLVNFTPPIPQPVCASELTILNRESPSSNRNPSPRPKRRLPVATVSGKALFLAARTGNKSIFLRILTSGAKITEVEPDGTTVLQAAAEANQLDVVLSLLFFGADPNSGGGQTRSPLLAATDRQHVQVVVALLEAKADPCAVHPKAPPRMKSAFHCALYHQNSEILSLLLDSIKQLDTNPDINIINDTGFYSDDDLFGTPLQVAVSLERADIVRCLLEYRADPNITCLNDSPWKRSPLAAAVYTQNPEILSILLGAGANPNVAPTILQYACSTGTLDSVKQLLDTNPDINIINDTGFYSDDDLFGTPLQVAVSLERADIVRCLLEYRADPNITCLNDSPWKRSPLAAAVYTQNPEILSILLGAGADPNVIPGLLSYVAENHDFQFVKVILDEGNANIDSADDTLGTALQVFAAKGQRDAMAYLLDLGADPNIEGGQYGSALNAAIANGHEHCIDELLGERSIESHESD